jgi:hypothetical protein
MLYMDQMTSSEFRKRYASLRVATMVTVNGHTIGTWQPQVTTDGQPIAELLAETSDPRRIPIERFNTAPFTPVPKRR